MQTSNCQNLNHRRSDAAVRFCPSCGEVVSQKIPPQRCLESLHAKERKEHAAYCIHCGKHLIEGPGR